MYKIKQEPNDFIVKELSETIIQSTGKYSYFTLKKENITTQDAIQIIAKTFRLRLKDIGFAGTKDKVAITTQTISAKTNFNGNKKFEKFEIIFLGKGDNPISLGDLKQNAFTITVRNLKEKKEILPIDCSPNYFDEQRFSTSNVEVGLLILRKKYKDAFTILKESHKRYRLDENLKNNDYVGAIKKIPLKILRFYISAVQSFIFNEVLAKYLEDKYNHVKTDKYSMGNFIFPKHLKLKDNIKIPIYGFNTKLHKDDISQLIKYQLKKLELTNRDFIIRAFPELSNEGTQRDSIIPIENFIVNTESDNDELHENMYKQKVSFILQKSSYATIVIRNLFT